MNRMTKIGLGLFFFFGGVGGWGWTGVCKGERKVGY